MNIDEIIMVDITLALLINIPAFGQTGRFNTIKSNYFNNRALSTTYLFNTCYFAMEYDLKALDEIKYVFI